ncbi:MAG TPA: hypothetical protein VK824_06650 [Planctomycetota bacterium]|nr:hypothetical protein [Planctomycetota bacterium]
MNLHIELDRESDGRWIADVVDPPGVLAYGASRDEALAAAKAPALRVLQGWPDVRVGVSRCSRDRTAHASSHRQEHGTSAKRPLSAAHPAAHIRR